MKIFKFFNKTLRWFKISKFSCSHFWRIKFLNYYLLISSCRLILVPLKLTIYRELSAIDEVTADKSRLIRQLYKLSNRNELKFSWRYKFERNEILCGSSRRFFDSFKMSSRRFGISQEPYGITTISGTHWRVVPAKKWVRHDKSGKNHQWTASSNWAISLSSSLDNSRSSGRKVS